MSVERAAGSNRRGEPRVPFDGAVRLRYRLFQQFLEENAANISPGGMFIRTIQPGDVGNELDFEIRLDDDFTLIQGRGEVAWVRPRGAESGAEPGMGIRFVDLPGDSRALVDKIVGDRVAAGLELFDLEGDAPATEAAPAERSPAPTPPAPEPPPPEPPPPVPSDPGEPSIWELDRGDEPVAGAPPDEPSGAPASEAPAAAPGPVPPPADNLVSLDPDLPPLAEVAPMPAAEPSSAARDPARAPGRRRAGLLRLIAVAVVSALVGAGAVLTFYWLYVQPSIDALETRMDALAGSPGGPWRAPEEEPMTEAAIVSVAAGGPDDPAAIQAGQSSEVVGALRGWAAAWSEQRVDDYLAYYAAEFTPPDGLARPVWEEARRARIARPRWIRVALTLVQVEPTGPDTAEVGFVQSYRSERYKDLVRKRLLMVREDDGWKIAAERSAP